MLALELMVILFFGQTIALYSRTLHGATLANVHDKPSLPMSNAKVGSKSI